LDYCHAFEHCARHAIMQHSPVQLKLASAPVAHTDIDESAIGLARA